MNNKKICFITAVNDEFIYEESIFYINRLDIPEDFEVEIRPVRNAYSITSAYNKAMQSSDAKYKVYIHQDTFIINQNFVKDILNIFKNQKNGMIGMCGSEKIPSSGIWWEANNKYGKVYDNRGNNMALLAFDSCYEDYKIVEAVDGLIIITQYDIMWREDLFKGWHFYDVSQCMEFKKESYNVVVPKQHTPWCIHQCGNPTTSNGFYKYNKIFVEEYLNKNI